LPIEPAAPVTNIVLSLSCLEIDLLSKTIGFRSNPQFVISLPFEISFDFSQSVIRGTMYTPL
jgi:hypothetical protein